MPALQKVLVFFIVILIITIIAAVYIYMETNAPGSNSGRDPNTSVQTPADASDQQSDQDIDTSPEQTPELTPVLDGINPLTGLPMDARSERNRPLAVVLNNIPEALPMNGVSKADIIYEYSVEGGLTRMLALYQDVSYTGVIGSIRSARHYTVQLAESYDAILVAAGRSPQAQTEVRNLGIPFLNEVEGPLRDIFYRDRNRISDRRVGEVHSVVTSGDRITEWLPEYDFRLFHDRNYEHTLFFVDDGTPQSGVRADEVTVRFSQGKTTVFHYDAQDRGYHARQGNRDFTDANDNSAPAFANILILKTSVTALRGDDSGRLDIETTGSGSGYYVSGGKAAEINWSRRDKSSPFVYTLTNGSHINFSAGKTYICIIPTNMDADFN